MLSPVGSLGGLTLAYTDCCDEDEEMMSAPGPSEQGREKITGRLVFIVSRDRPDLYNYLMLRFAGQKDIEVILDRRRGERRPHEPERRRADPRNQSSDGDDPFGLSGVICRRLEGENPTTVHTAQPLASQGRDPVGQSSQPPQGQAILVVDDEPAVAALLAELLTIEGHEVETAPNGAIALTKLRGRVYKLILCDLQMPELDGPGVYREVMRRYPEIARRFVFITGSAPTLEVTKFLKQTGAPSLSKPFDLDELERMIQKVLQAV